MIEREIAALLKLYSQSFRSVLIIGPRQSGKTTLAKSIFPQKPYVSLENPDESFLALNDPRAFLNRFPKGAILDEIQRTPLLLNYLQEILDNTKEDGLFILTGSNNILLVEHITQTLAGRVGVLDLLPLSFSEIYQPDEKPLMAEVIIRGFYPEIIAKKRNPGLWFPSYIRTYVERDVRQIKQIEDVFLFQKFLSLCAGRIGQQLNLSSLSNVCGINIKTTQSWLSILESTYIIRLLQPYHENFNKRIVKSPKLYFCDTGLACSLLNIRTTNELILSHFRGALVENLIIMESIKNTFNTNNGNQYYYWRDNNGVEIDLLIQCGIKITPIEIKSAQTFTKDFSSNLKKFFSYSGLSKGLVLYDGAQTINGSDGIDVMNWTDFVRFE
ncbi:MAG: ATP-binding protein [Bacteroidota bacterium]|jgi:predicted AAA+ superfamily ATPase